jgi:hypothetical protein
MKNSIDVKANLNRMMISSCSCLTKTPISDYHYVDCRYRQLNEILEYIEDLEYMVKFYEEGQPR